MKTLLLCSPSACLLSHRLLPKTLWYGCREWWHLQHPHRPQCREDQHRILQHLYGLSGYDNSTGSYNTFLGREAGINNQSSNNNVFIGFGTGYSETGSNKLYIDNNNDNKPLLYGNFSFNVLSIGKKYTSTAYKLDVPGSGPMPMMWSLINGSKKMCRASRMHRLKCKRIV